MATADKGVWVFTLGGTEKSECYKISVKLIPSKGKRLYLMEIKFQQLDYFKKKLIQISMLSYD